MKVRQRLSYPAELNLCCIAHFGAAMQQNSLAMEEACTGEFVLRQGKPNPAAHPSLGFLASGMFQRIPLMPSFRTLQTIAPSTREKMFLGLIVTLAVAQLIAFWMVCSHQVREAQAREATLQVRTASGSRSHDVRSVLTASENTAQPAVLAGQRRVNFSVH
jgi:hypothetical protein